MTGRKAADYEDALVELLADGGKTYAEIAEAVGLSEAYVGKVARGERRPELQVRLQLSRQARMNEAKRLGARWAGALLRRHIQVGIKGEDETARKCREFALDRCCFGPEPTSAEVNPAVSLALARVMYPSEELPDGADGGHSADETAEDFSPGGSGGIGGLDGEEDAAPMEAQAIVQQALMGYSSPVEEREDAEGEG